MLLCNNTFADDPVDNMCSYESGYGDCKNICIKIIGASIIPYSDYCIHGTFIHGYVPTDGGPQGIMFGQANLGWGTWGPECIFWVKVNEKNKVPDEDDQIYEVRLQQNYCGFKGGKSKVVAVPVKNPYSKAEAQLLYYAGYQHTSGHWTVTFINHRPH